MTYAGVSILVLMDSGREVIITKTMIYKTIIVSILVLMDSGREVVSFCMFAFYKEVSILVLMDSGREEKIRREKQKSRV